MSSYFVYVIKSSATGRLYKGFCSDLNRRIGEHNAGKTKSTKPFAPWELVYFEKFNSKSDAIDREKYLKSAAGRRFILKILAPGSPPVRPAKDL